MPQPIDVDLTHGTRPGLHPSLKKTGGYPPAFLFQTKKDYYWTDFTITPVTLDESTTIDAGID